MKRFIFILSVFTLVSLCFSGCGKRPEAPFPLDSLRSFRHTTALVSAFGKENVILIAPAKASGDSMVLLFPNSNHEVIFSFKEDGITFKDLTAHGAAAWTLKNGIILGSKAAALEKIAGSYIIDLSTGVATLSAPDTLIHPVLKLTPSLASGDSVVHSNNAALQKENPEIEFIRITWPDSYQSETHFAGSDVDDLEGDPGASHIYQLDSLRQYNTASALTAHFGKENTTWMRVEPYDTVFCAFKGTPRQVLFQQGGEEPATFGRMIIKTPSLWATAQGVYPGMSIGDLESVVGKPFQVSSGGIVLFPYDGNINSALLIVTVTGLESLRDPKEDVMHLKFRDSNDPVVTNLHPSVSEVILIYVEEGGD